MSLNGIKDLDREILKRIPDEKLLKVCTINKKMYYEVCDDAFIKRKLSKYPNLEMYKDSDKSWKSFFTSVIRYKKNMKEEFDFEYTEGNFEKQYSLLKQHTDGLLLYAVLEKEMSLIKYCINKRSDDLDFALSSVASFGDLDIIKYLMAKGANTPSAILQNIIEKRLKMINKPIKNDF
jgi:ankyrin repeat protein